MLKKLLITTTIAAGLAVGCAQGAIAGGGGGGGGGAAWMRSMATDGATVTVHQIPGGRVVTRRNGSHVETDTFLKKERRNGRGDWAQSRHDDGTTYTSRTNTGRMATPGRKVAKVKGDDVEVRFEPKFLGAFMTIFHPDGTSATSRSTPDGGRKVTDTAGETRKVPKRTEPYIINHTTGQIVTRAGVFPNDR